MPRYVILLRGINLGATNRIPMTTLREAFAQAGLGEVRTYLQSGNIVVPDAASPAGLAAATEQLIAQRFGCNVSAMIRSTEELAAVVKRNPFEEAAQSDPKHYQVTFLSGEPNPESFAQVIQLADPTERIATHGREIYAWHPAGIHLSKLANRLTPKVLGVDCATARNWTTVTQLLELASHGE